MDVDSAFCASTAASDLIPVAGDRDMEPCFDLDGDLAFDDHDDDGEARPFANPPALEIDNDSWAMDEAATASIETAKAETGLKSIVDGELYLGAFRDANDAAACAALGIGAYLCVAKEVQVPSHAVAAGAPALHLRLVDGHSERLAEHIPAAVAFIEAQVAAGRRVALFCQQGRSRSVSLAVAYVQRRVAGRQEASAALEYVSQRYTRADPNLWFLQQLMSPT